MADFVADIGKIVEQWGQELNEKLRESIARKGNNANGDQFAASFTNETIIGEDYVEFKMEAPSWYDVIDKGGKRWTNKMPPVNDIMDWMAHKGIQASVKAKKTPSVASSIKKHTGTYHTNSKYSAQRSMAFAIAVNIKKHGVLKRFSGKGSNFYSDVVNEEAFIDLRKRIIDYTQNPNFILKFIDPNQS